MGYIIGTKQASVAQLVEHHVANVIVAGSNPVTRSIFFAEMGGEIRALLLGGFSHGRTSPLLLHLVSQNPNFPRPFSAKSVGWYGYGPDMVAW